MRMIVFAAVLALAACGKTEVTTPSGQSVQISQASAPAPSCAAQSAGSWQVAGKTYKIEARAEGSTCPDAVATLRLLAPDGAALFEMQHRIRDVPLAFSGRDDQATLQTELDAWTANVSQWPTAEGLPPWPVGADKPPHMTVHADRTDYEAARGARLPLFCFPDGNESNACLALDPETGHALLMGSWNPERL